MMSINAVKGVEVGAGFGAASLSGEENADQMRAGNDGPLFLSNNNGGVAGGISTGQDLIVRIAIKPTSSILNEVQSVTRDGERCRRAHQGPPRPLRRHPRRARGRVDDGLRAGRPETAPPRPDRKLNPEFKKSPRRRSTGDSVFPLERWEA
jgi:hypothetical protein